MAEDLFRPDWFSKPGDTLSALMAKHEISLPDLTARINGNATLLHGLLAGTVAIDEDLATRLADCVGGSPSFWSTRQAQFGENLDRVASAVLPDDAKSWLGNLPLKELRDAGWLSSAGNRIDLIKSSLSFFDVVDPKEWRERYTAFESEFDFRKSPSFESKLGALSAWLRQGEIYAETIPCAAWNAQRLRSKIASIRRLTKAKDPSYFVPRLRTICADCGVAVVFVRAPTGCRTSGATRFLSKSKALILLSFRHLSDDHFWFTFFHELGHLLIHGDKLTFIDGETTDETIKEREANDFASRTLVPQEHLETLMELRARSLDIIRFAVSVGVSPGIIVGQMQHLGLIGYKHMNHLKRRYTWDQILYAIS